MKFGRSSEYLQALPCCPKDDSWKQDLIQINLLVSFVDIKPSSTYDRLKLNCHERINLNLQDQTNLFPPAFPVIGVVHLIHTYAYVMLFNYMNNFICPCLLLFGPSSFV